MKQFIAYLPPKYFLPLSPHLPPPLCILLLFLLFSEWDYVNVDFMSIYNIILFDSSLLSLYTHTPHIVESYNIFADEEDTGNSGKLVRSRIKCLMKMNGFLWHTKASMFSSGERQREREIMIKWPCIKWSSILSHRLFFLNMIVTIMYSCTK